MVRYSGYPVLMAMVLAVPAGAEEDLGAMWGTAAEEAKYYPIVEVAIPPGVPMRPGSFEVLPDGRLAVGTRRGDIYCEGGFREPAGAGVSSVCERAG
jgi:hypothetical protein